jgi:hypothetical protein
MLDGFLNINPSDFAVNSTSGTIVLHPAVTAIPLGQFVRKNQIQGNLGRRLSRCSRIFRPDDDYAWLRTSKALECVIGRVLDASIPFVKQANSLKCFMAQHESVLRS